jgi:hypothetical protein
MHEGKSTRLAYGEGGDMHVRLVLLGILSLSFLDFFWWLR